MADLDRATMEKLGDSNYATWATRMEFYLRSKDLWTPVEEAGHAESSKTRAVIGLAVRDQHLDTVATAASAKAAWDALKGVFAAQGSARKLALKKALNSLQMESSENCSQFIARAKGLKQSLAAAGCPAIPDDELVLSILAGLPEAFDTLVTTLTHQHQAELSLVNIQIDLLQYEQQLRDRQTKQHGAEGSGGARRGPAAKAFLADQPVPSWSGRGRGRGRGRGGRASGGERINGSLKHLMPCHNCGILGHFAAECRKPRQDRRDGEGPPQQRGGVALTAVGAATAVEPSSWILDSGATSHMTGDRSLLSSFKEAAHKVKVTSANGQSAFVAGEGEALVHTKEMPEGILLQKVLYVPDFTYSLLSIPTAVGNGAVVTWTATACHISVGKRTVASVSYGPDGLCKLASSQRSEAALLSQPAETAELWHRRFGHLGFESMAQLVRGDMVSGINVSAADFSNSNKQLCEPCVLAKHCREPFPSSDSKSTKPLQLVHMDVCGPIQVDSLGGSRYFATYLDDFSRVSVVQPIDRKSDVYTTTLDVLAKLERLSGQRVRAVRTDGGGEYLSNALEDYFRKQGITHQVTVRYSPQQNGAAERLNRTLMERVRAMLEDSQLDSELWAEAVVTANYIRNRSPAAGEAKTPWELFHGSKPSVSELRTFGARAYAQVPDQLRRKLDSKSERGVMVGYAVDTKGYRILLPGGQVIISRDVVFDEVATAPLSPPAKPKPAGSAEPAEQVTETVGAEVSNREQQDSPEEQQPEEPHGSKPRYPTRQRRQPAAWWKGDTATANLAATTQIVEPTSLEEALASKQASEWKTAMDEEMRSLYENNTWVLEDLPAGSRTIPVKWVYKLKKSPTGVVERFKARLVAKGYKQREGIDFDEVYAPVSKHSSLRAVLALAAAEDLELHVLDIKTAFLNGELEETVYIDQPPGYEQGSKVAHLRRALYGLRQAPRAWHLRLKQELESMGFEASDADPGLFTSQHKTGLITMLVYVDDLLIAAHSSAAVSFVKDKIMKAFDTRDLGEASSFLGMSIQRDRASGSIKLAQSNMVNELAEKYGLADAKPKGVPLSPATQLSKLGGEPLDTAENPYSALVGSMLYLSVCTRPDIAQAVGVLCKYMAAPTSEHWAAARGVLRYLMSTAALGITFGVGSGGSSSCSELLGYSDADFAGDVDTRRSTTAYVFLLNHGAISWSSRRQTTVAASTAEAEYMAEASAAKEAIWLRKLLSSLGKPTGTIKILADNQAAIKLASNPATSARSKHIDVQYHFVRERVASQEIVFEYVPTAYMVADALTKAVPEEKTSFCRDSMGIL